MIIFRSLFELKKGDALKENIFLEFFWIFLAFFMIKKEKLQRKYVWIEVKAQRKNP